jgi:hypothetical protein
MRMMERVRRARKAGRRVKRNSYTRAERDTDNPSHEGYVMAARSVPDAFTGSMVDVR